MIEQVEVALLRLIGNYYLEDEYHIKSWSSGSSFCRNNQNNGMLNNGMQKWRTCCSNFFHLKHCLFFQYTLYHYLQQLCFLYMLNDLIMYALPEREWQ